ncbi:unnamed protein product [Cylicocyclus nassatus]|uniref:7TM GPCR serpentine receptor class x (Srx) domain-containing protein n=1 Tax=Cylicocyclus nassatus TaxID=53992 RepID=A0AA36HCG8_CYLNA|nr:unnamed protein product [Cylicocyclus nassatus]
MGIVIFVSVLSAAYTSVYFKAGCDFYFDHENGVWSFGSDPCSVWISFYIDMCYNVFLFLTIIIIDIATLIQLKSTTRSMLSRSVQIDDKQNNDISSKRRRKELLLFTQTFVNSLMYAFMLLCFHLVAPSVSTNFQLFLCTTLVWGLSHTFGGVILIVFNPEVRRHIVNFRDISRSLREQATTVITVKLSQPLPQSQKLYQ